MAISDAIDILTSSRKPKNPIDTLKTIARAGRSFELLIEALGQDKQMEVIAALGAIIDFLGMLDGDSGGGDLKKAVENGVVEAATEAITDPIGSLLDVLSILGAVNGLMGAEIPLFNYILDFSTMMLEGIQQGGGPDTGIAPFMPEEGSPADNAADNAKSIFGMDDDGGGDGGGDISDVFSVDADADGELDATEPDIFNPTDISQEDFSSLWDTIQDLDEDSLDSEQTKQLDELVDEFLDEFGTEDDIVSLFGSN